MKCEICGNKIATIFMDKILGTYVKDEKGKKHLVCTECQKKIHTKEDILKQLK